MNTKEQRFDIVDGPSKDRLVDAFKYAYDKQVCVPVKFDIAPSRTTSEDGPSRTCTVLAVEDLRIVSLQHEDGSGHSLNIEGYCRADFIVGKLKESGGCSLPIAGYYVDDTGKLVDAHDYRFKMYYNAQTRKGMILLKEK